MANNSIVPMVLSFLAFGDSWRRGEPWDEFSYCKINLPRNINWPGEESSYKNLLSKPKSRREFVPF